MIMKKPEMEVIRFESADIVAASSGAKTITLSGMGNADKTDNGFAFGTNNLVGVNTYTIKTAMADYFDAGFSTAGASDIVFNTGTKSANLNKLYRGDESATAGFNGTYVWDGSGTYTFTKKS